jgi:hypothetical protein
MATAKEIAAVYARNNPESRFAVSKCGSAVGLWIESRQAFVEIVVKTISPKCPWVTLLSEDGSMIQTTLANGKPLYPPEEWESV